MDALVMCGGRGTRLDANCEKPLYPIAGRPLVDHVLDAAVESRIERVHAAVSPNTPETAAHLDSSDRSPVSVLHTPGDGYVADLETALAQLETPLLTVAADLPLLTGTLVDDLLSEYETDSLTVAVPVGLKELLGASYEYTTDYDGTTVVPTGLNIVTEGRSERTALSYDARLAINVNYQSDADIAATLL